MNELRVVLPLPPSANNAYPSFWRKGRYRRIVSEKGTAFKDEVSILVQVARAKVKWTYETNARFSLSINLYFGDNRRRDISNCVKLLEDAISETLGFDDSAIDELHVKRMSVKSKVPQAEIIIHCVEVDCLVD